MENIPEKMQEFPANGGKRARPFTLEQTRTLAKQQEFWNLCENDTDLRELMNERGETFSFKTNAMSSGFTFIKKTCFSMFYTSLSGTPPERWIPDMLHWFINVIGRDLVDFICDHAEQLEYKLELLDRELHWIAGKKVVTGYEGDQSIALCRRYLEWIEAIADHPN